MREVVRLEDRRRGRRLTGRELRFDRAVKTILGVLVSVYLAYYALEWLLLHGYL